MPACPVPPAPGRPDRRVGATRQPVLLVVDDEVAIGDLLEIWFGAVGWKVQTACSGPEGIARAEVNQPDVVLLDLMLPGDGGMQVLRRLREMDPYAVVVLTSGWDGPAERAAAMAAGAADYIVKPFSLRALELRLQELLTAHAPRRR